MQSLPTQRMNGNDSAQLLTKLRADTPGTQLKVHFNNAGAALPVSQVLDAQVAYLKAETIHGGYETAINMHKELQRPYDALAKMLNCNPRNIAITQSASSAWSQVFFGIPFQQGDRVLTSVAEYASNYIAFLQVAKRSGIEIEVIPEDEEGEIDFDALEGMLSSDRRTPTLIAINHIPTNSGRVYDAAEVGRVAKRHGVPYLLDACQSVGQMPLDVSQLGCDWLTATSRKYLRGPRGMGFLYASDEAMERFEPAVLDLHGAQWMSASSYEMYPGAVRYEQYEKSYAAQAGFGVAIDYALELGLEWIWERIQLLAGKLRTLLRTLEGITVHDRGRNLCGIVTFSKECVSPDDVKAHLAARDINIHLTQISSTRIDFEKNKLPDAVVRASLSYYNTEEEIDTFMAAVKSL